LSIYCKAEEDEEEEKEEKIRLKYHVGNIKKSVRPKFNDGDLEVKIWQSVQNCITSFLSSTTFLFETESRKFPTFEGILQAFICSFLLSRRINLLILYYCVKRNVRRGEKKEKIVPFGRRLKSSRGK
jgi:hypothetical protein